MVTTFLKFSWTFFLIWSASTVLANGNQRAKKGENVVLRCNAKKPLNWLNEENEIIGRQKGRIQQNVNGDLVIKSVKFSDRGLYTCSSADGQTLHTKVHLEISGPPTLVNITENIAVQNNKSAALTCLAEGHPEPTITWFMYKEGQRQEIAEGSTLNTRILCKFCQVYFLCKAKNKFGEDSVNITVNSVGKPEVTLAETSVVGSLGQNVTVHCTIKSNPLLRYMKWIKRGKLVESNNRKRIDFEIISRYETRVTLTIEKLKQKDFDEYECLASNIYGNETQKLTISSTLPRSSPLSRSTELIIRSEDIQKQTTKSKNQDKAIVIKEETTTKQSSTESVSSNMGSDCKKSWKQLTTFLILSLVICASFFFS